MLIRTFLILILLFVLACSDDEKKQPIDQTCELTFTNDPGSALELITEGELGGAEIQPEGSNPSSDPGLVNLEEGSISQTETSGPIEIFLCSDVVSLDENTITLEGALSLVRQGVITKIGIGQRPT